ncbi:MAG: hypothetical protein KC468_35290 [Myxococcales bacterium]|nr:hypothetical protein [Myxococcales bacterium]
MLSWRAQLARLGALASLVIACQPPEEPLSGTPVALAPVDYSELRFDWDVAPPRPATRESIREDALAPARERDDADIPSRFHALLDAVDRSGLPDISGLTFWRVGDTRPVHNGAMPRGAGYWTSSSWSQGGWVVDTEGAVAPDEPITRRVTPALIANPDALARAVLSRRGDAKRERFANFVVDEITSMEETEDGRRRPSRERRGFSRSFERVQWLRWARWAQMSGDAESAVALLEQYEREVRVACVEACEGEPVRDCDLEAYARADLAERVEQDAGYALREHLLPWDRYARQLETALALDPPVDPLSERALALSGVRRYMERRWELAPLLERGLPALSAAERAEVILALWPDFVDDLNAPGSAFYDARAELDKLPIDALPLAAWYFGEGSGVPVRSGGRYSWSRGGRFPWPLCDLADARWLPERERGWCGTEARACGLEIILNRVSPETRARLPPRDELDEELPREPYISWSNERVRGLVSCGERTTLTSQQRRRALAMECWVRGAAIPAERYGRGPRQFARLAGSSAARGLGYDYADVDSGEWTSFARWGLEVLVASAEPSRGEQAGTLAPRHERALLAGVAFLERERLEAGLGELEFCGEALDQLEGPIAGLDIPSLEADAELASWHQQHHDRLSELVKDAMCTAYHIDTLSARPRDERHLRRYRSGGLSELQERLGGIATSSPLINAMMTPTRLLPRAADESKPRNLDRLRDALREPARAAGVELPELSGSDADRDALCGIETRPRPKQRR